MRPSTNVGLQQNPTPVERTFLLSHLMLALYPALRNFFLDTKLSLSLKLGEIMKSQLIEYFFYMLFFNLLSKTSGFSRSSSFRFPSRFSMVSTTQKLDFEGAQKLATDLISIISETGFEAGVSRTFQAVRAANSILRRYITDPKIFEDNGQVSPAKAVKAIFEELGATYIKLGQFIASSPTLFPAEYVLAFQSCLDNAPSIPYSEIRKIIQEDLGKPISSVFASVDPVPLATASIAQVTNYSFPLSSVLF